MAVGLFDLVGVVIEEVTNAVPRAVDRTRAQVELLQRLLGTFPCSGAVGNGDLPADEVAEVVPIRAGSDDGPTVTAPVPEPPSVAPDVASLAIPDYDSLAASQVVPRLASLDASELADVAEYERAHRGRQTILNRVRQLQVSSAG